MVISSGKRSPRGIQTPLTYLTSGPTFPSQVHCISTEFTPRKHGGEKGVPFRVQIDTFKQNENGEYTEHLHSASCQIKVFKPKGADRKQKTDREKMEKRTAQEKEKYQPSYETTILTEVSWGCSWEWAWRGPWPWCPSGRWELAESQLTHPVSLLVGYSEITLNSLLPLNMLVQSCGSACKTTTQSISPINPYLDSPQLSASCPGHPGPLVLWISAFLCS